MSPEIRERITTTLNACVGWCEERRIVARVLPMAVLVGIVGGLLYAFLLSAPRGFTAPRLITVERGATLEEVAALLREEGVIRSTFWFSAFAMLLRGDTGVVAGSYYFPDRESVVTIASRLVSGEYQLEPTRVTVPEGTSRREIAALLKERLGVFDGEEFMRLTEGKEGYLFPDTYFFLPGEDPQVVADAMEHNFVERIQSLEDKIAAFGKDLHEVITMASLLEEEARQFETRRMISGILWKRIAIGMRLQVDAVFPYIIGKNTFQLTRDDLAVDSPYNTYRIDGLPLGPITNPGLEAIEAAVTPIKSSYLYYLSDMQGEMHYSRTHDEHVRKKALYL